MAALLGCGAIAVAREVTVTRLLAPLVVMAAYLAYGLSQGRRNTPKLADSIYFLGFLWTLWALIYTIIARGGQLHAHDVFLVFGYALVTTGAGIFCRLALIQFHIALSDQETTAREDIEGAVTRFVSTLSEGDERLRASQDEIMSTLKAWSQVTTTQWSATLHGAEEKCVASLENTTRRLGASLDGVSTNIDAIAQASNEMKVELHETTQVLRSLRTRLDSSLTRFASDVATESTHITGALVGFAARLDAIEVPKEALSARLDSLIGHAEQLVHEILTRLASDFRAESTHAMQALASFAARVDAIEIPPNAIVSQLESLIELAEPAVGRLAAGADQLAANCDRCFNSVGQLTSEADRLFGEVVRINDLIKEMPGAIRQLENSVVDLCGDVQSRAAKHIEVAEIAIADVKAAGADLQRTTREVLEFTRRHLDGKP